MSISEQSAYHLEFQRSREFFTNPGSYMPFDLTLDRRRIFGCVDPRNELTDTLKTVVQTAGGGVGEGHDDSLAKTADTGGLYGIEDGIASDVQTRRTTVLGAHRTICRFLGSLADVLHEESQPSPFTLDAIQRWSRLYELDDTVIPLLPRISQAAARQEDHIREYGTGDVINLVDRLYPNHANVVNMQGQNQARFYITNHHPHVGLDRTTKHRVLGLQIHSYHDSLRATVDDLNNTYGIPPRIRGLRLTALFARSAAVRTLLGGAHDDTEYYEVVPTDRGPQVVLQQSP